MGGHLGVRKTLARAIVLSAIACASCRRRPPPAPPDESATPAPSGPVDQLAPGELAEGKDKLFGFPVPRRMKITARFGDEAFATGDIAMEDVANYVRARVNAEHIETGPTKTLFTGVKMKRDPDSKQLNIEVLWRGPTRTELTLYDASKAKPDPNVTLEQRSKDVGVTPDGKLVDPTHLR